MNHRSLNGETLCIFDYVISGMSKFDLIRKTSAVEQRAALWRIAGRWEDDRSFAEIIAEIEGANMPQKSRGRCLTSRKRYDNISANDGKIAEFFP